MKNYDVFLFDADGTLFDFNMAETNALKIIFKNCNFKFSDDILAKYREINIRAWESYEKGEISKSELQVIRFERLFEYAGIKHDEKEFNDMYLYELGKGSFLIEGALEICKEIKAAGGIIYIVTNGILATQEARIKHSLIKDYISGYFVSEHIGYQKPHKSYFDYVFSHIVPAEKEKIIIIGDSLTADIAGGNNAGIDSCWFNASCKFNDTDITPVYEISSLLELRNFFVNRQL